MLKTDKIPMEIADQLYPREDHTMTESQMSGPFTISSDDVAMLHEAADELKRKQLGAVVKEAVVAGAQSRSGAALYAVPTVDGDFADAPDIARLAQELILEHADRIGHVEDAFVRFAWKRQGGKAKGNATLGKCVKLSGPARHFANGAEFLVWLAADHCRTQRFSDHQVRALLFHELLHIECDETDDGELVWSVRGHDLEEFRAVIECYGLWADDLKQMAETFRQVGLPGV